MDEFKRKYSNEDTLTVALPYFWDHFDREGFSIWYAEYRFPEELSMTFMSCNLITGTIRSLCLVSLNSGWNAITLFLDCSFQFSMFYLRKSFALLGFKKYVQVLSCSSGMFQRLDKLRKNAFASVILFGANNDSCISGIWVFRGQDLAFPVSNFHVLRTLFSVYACL